MFVFVIGGLMAVYLLHLRTNVKLRLQTLADQTPTLYTLSSKYVVTFLRRGEAAAAKGDLSAAVERLVQVAKQNGGEVICKYPAKAVHPEPASLTTDHRCPPPASSTPAHRCWLTRLCSACGRPRSLADLGYTEIVAVKSAQLPADVQEWCDLVVLSKWAGDSASGCHGYARFGELLTTAEGWSWQLSQPFTRTPIVNFLLLPVGMLLLRLKTMMLLQQHRIDRRPSVPNPALERAAASLERMGAAGDGVMVFNLLNGGNKFCSDEDRSADRAYAQNMLELHSQHGGGPVHLGRAGRAEGEGSPQWKIVAAVYYPGRAFFCRLLRSQWMAEPYCHHHHAISLLPRHVKSQPVSPGACRCSVRGRIAVAARADVWRQFLRLARQPPTLPCHCQRTRVWFG